MSIVIDDHELAIPGLRTVSWREDPSFALAIPDDGAPRPARRVTAITLHTTDGALGPVRPGLGASRDIARKTAQSWRRSPAQGGAHLLVDTDGLVACTCDLARTVARHAGGAGDFTVGVEICQAAGATLYAEQLQVVVRVVDFLTAALGIQRQIPHAYKKRLARLATQGRSFFGVFGHRDQVSGRGRGDPGDEIFNLLTAAGYERYDLGAGQDLNAWKQRQRALGMSEAQIDGVPGETTRGFLRAAGYADGLWVARPAFAGPPPPPRPAPPAGVSLDLPTAPRTRLPAEYEFPSPLARGEKGPRVKLLQELLVIAGHKVTLDASYGPGTEGAVRAFQVSLGQPGTGAVDAGTWDLLKSPVVRALRPLAAGDDLGALVVRYAEQHLALHPVEVGGENRGPWVRLYTGGKDGRAYAWCAGFATYVLRQAAESAGLALPLACSLACDNVAESARRRRQFVSESDLATGKVPRDALRPGTLFLVRKGPGDWHHTGIVVRAEADSFETIEGNTNDDGSREGYEVCRHHRGYASHDFALLAPRG